MADDMRTKLKKLIRDEIDKAVDKAHVAVSTTRGATRTHHSVTSKQTVVERNGESYRFEERTERREP